MGFPNKTPLANPLRPFELLHNGLKPHCYYKRNFTKSGLLRFTRNDNKFFLKYLTNAKKFIII